jgi:AcrR family transcriptional regulator
MVSRRGRGRPRKRAVASALQAGGLDRAGIIERALDLTRTEALATISIVRLAESLNVQPGTIHYHIGSRANLLTGVMNQFYRKLLARMASAPPKDTWQAEIRRIGTELLDAKLTYPGIASYVTSNDRFRVFQKPGPGEDDYGARFMSDVFALLERAGFTPDLAAECWHFVALYTNSSAESIAMKHSPAEHAAFLLDHAKRYDASRFPGLAFGLPALARLDATAAFRRGFDDLILGFGRRVAEQTLRSGGGSRVASTSGGQRRGHSRKSASAPTARDARYQP